MKKVIVILVCLTVSLVGSAFIPGMSGHKDATLPVKWKTPAIEYNYMERLPAHLMQLEDVDQRKQCLIDSLLPLVLKANESILAQRSTVERLKQKLPRLSEQDKRTLEGLADSYLVESGPYDRMIDELLLRVDVLPVSLVLAQAAIESGWGSSRFCYEGNNLFGLRSLSGGGIVPKGRPERETYAVSVFYDLQSCIDYYFWVINTRPEYEELRLIRGRSFRPYDSHTLSRGLKFYSEIGTEYVKRVDEVINYNGLKSYDNLQLRFPLQIQG
jgi:Bax protein